MILTDQLFILPTYFEFPIGIKEGKGKYSILTIINIWQNKLQ